MKTCGAKTRRGTPCRRAPMENGRCSNHGGKSLRYFAHPNYKHGRYSKYSGIMEDERAERLERKQAEKRAKAIDKLVEQFVAEKGREPKTLELIKIIRKTRV